MTQISSLTALTGAGVDTAVDLLPIVDMSLAGAARNKKITVAEAKIALGVGAAITELDDIPDVNAPTPTNGDVLTWDSTPGEWVPTAPATGATTLDDLTDVNTPTPADGDFLMWDSTPGEWVPGTPAGGVTDLDDLSDVNLTGQTTGDVLTYDGAEWVPQAPSGGSLPSSLYEDQKPANTSGGTSTTGAWGGRILNTEVYDDIGLALRSSTFTVTIASPGVFSWTAHGLAAGSVILLTTTGALPTGLTASTAAAPVPYYVIAAGLTANTFQVSATLGGAAVNTSGTQSGTHTASSGTISLAAGTYEIDCTSMIYRSNGCRIRVQDLTNSVTLALSDNGYTSSTDGTMQRPAARGRFTLAGTAIVELQYRVASTLATFGLGVESNFGVVEIYSRLKLTKLS